ncbi:MAG: hypothetical protein IT319_21650 [Anaerolineae bacterium]|nr:hypothetical protein [Anaerolineae bacterium]
MSKYRVFAIMCLLVTSMALIAQAQDDQPLTQPTIDAAVGALLAQTRIAPTQIAATQTIQAALETALTATAGAPVAPAGTPTPTPFDVSSLEVVDTTEVELLAGPARSAAYLAPSGEVFAHIQQTLCVYEGAAEQSCVELPEELSSLDLESVRWSPDSRYLTFQENFFQFFMDPDIWVWDTQTGDLRDLTNDGQHSLSLSNDTWKNIDVMSDWLPDGRIIFLRYNRINGNHLPPDVYTIEPGGSRLTKLGALLSSDPLAIYGISVAGDRLFYNYTPAGDSIFRGIWMSNLDGSDAEVLLATQREQLISGIRASADGRYVMLLSQPIQYDSREPEDSWAQILDVETGESTLIDPDHYVVGAGWSPTGSALVYIVNNREKPDDNGLYITGTPGEPGRLLLAGDFNLPNLGRWQNLTWGANNTVLLSRSPQEGIVLVQLGE